MVLLDNDGVSFGADFAYSNLNASNYHFTLANLIVLL